MRVVCTKQRDNEPNFEGHCHLTRCYVVQLSDSALATKISFSLSKKSLGEFNRANIILALKDEVNLSDDGSVLTIVVSMKDFQVLHIVNDCHKLYF